MKPPAFWWQAPGTLARMLSTLSWIWQAVTARRMRQKGTTPGVPVICVGNLTLGGTGKTPTVIAILERFGNATPHVVMRGHGGALKGPVRVDPTRHSAAEVGDEALLLAAFAPVWVARNRASGALEAVAAGASHIVLDDGFQNPSLTKDLSYIVVDAETAFGNGCVVPAGPLREPVAAGLKRADHLIVVGPPDARRQFLSQHTLSLPVTEAEILPLQTGMDWRGLRVVAFAGIGRPAKFFDTLKRLGAEVVASEALGDHAPIGPHLFARFQALAKSQQAQLVTTEKDAVRLPTDARRQVLVLPVRLQFADAAKIDGDLNSLDQAS